jgi:hypothetical protein
MPAIVKILIAYVKICRIYGRTLRTSVSLNGRIESLYGCQREEISV